MEKDAAETGVIHGRFQVLHNDHLRYLLAGKALCRHLVVGITNPDPRLTREDPSDPLRSAVALNPLTYYERYVMVREVLVGAGLSLQDFSVVPFPINFPELYPHYLPMDALFFLSIYDDWGRQKLRTFQSMGLRTHVLWEVSPENKGISAGDVRRHMQSGQPWEYLVPPQVPPLMRRWDIPARIKRLEDPHPGAS